MHNQATLVQIFYTIRLSSAMEQSGCSSVIHADRALLTFGSMALKLGSSSSTSKKSSEAVTDRVPFTTAAGAMSWALVLRFTGPARHTDAAQLPTAPQSPTDNTRRCLTRSFNKLKEVCNTKTCV